MSNASDERIKIIKKIQDWLRPEGWVVEIINQPNYEFAIQVKQNVNSGFFVLVQKYVDRVIILTRIGFSIEDRNSYKLSKNKKQFWLNLKTNLILLGVMTKITPDLDNLETIELNRVIYFDGMDSKDKFFENITKVTDALALCNLAFEQFKSSISPSNQ